MLTPALPIHQPHPQTFHKRLPALLIAPVGLCPDRVITAVLSKDPKDDLLTILLFLSHGSAGTILAAYNDNGGNFRRRVIAIDGDRVFTKEPKDDVLAVLL